MSSVPTSTNHPTSASTPVRGLTASPSQRGPIPMDPTAADHAAEHLTLALYPPPSFRQIGRILVRPGLTYAAHGSLTVRDASGRKLGGAADHPRGADDGGDGYVVKGVLQDRARPSLQGPVRDHSEPRGGREHLAGRVPVRLGEVGVRRQDGGSRRMNQRVAFFILPSRPATRTSW